jgi:GNAT superfamily N-acetyltransferase
MVEIKPILPEHWPVLKDIRLRALTDAPGAFGTTLAEAQAYLDKEWQARAQRFSEMPAATGGIAYLDDVPCGMASAFPSTENTHTAGMTAFWVAPEHRGQGVADAMVTFLVNWATGQSHSFHGDTSKRIILLAKRLTSQNSAWEAWD